MRSLVRPQDGPPSIPESGHYICSGRAPLAARASRLRRMYVRSQHAALAHGNPFLWLRKERPGGRVFSAYVSKATSMQVVMLIFPNMTQLDLTGPFEVFARFKEFKIALAWKTSDPVTDGSGLKITPSATFSNCPMADILFVPGGPGQLALMEDVETLDFLRKQASSATYITSVCTGSLVLAAAGLLTGYRATSHWMSISQLAYFDVEPVAERVVIDRNRITGAGVTSGIDFALTLVSRIFGEERAKLVQLSMEYDPQPPFAGGSVINSDTALIEKLRNLSETFQHQREIVSQRVANELKGFTKHNET